MLPCPIEKLMKGQLRCCFMEMQEAPVKQQFQSALPKQSLENVLACETNSDVSFESVMLKAILLKPRREESNEVRSRRILNSYSAVLTHKKIITAIPKRWILGSLTHDMLCSSKNDGNYDSVQSTDLPGSSSRNTCTSTPSVATHKTKESSLNSRRMFKTTSDTIPFMQFIRLRIKFARSCNK